MDTRNKNSKIKRPPSGFFKPSHVMPDLDDAFKYVAYHLTLGDLAVFSVLSKQHNKISQEKLARIKVLQGNCR